MAEPTGIKKYIRELIIGIVISPAIVISLFTFGIDYVMQRHFGINMEEARMAIEHWKQTQEEEKNKKNTTAMGLRIDDAGIVWYRGENRILVPAHFENEKWWWFDKKEKKWKGVYK